MRFFRFGRKNFAQNSCFFVLFYLIFVRYGNFTAFSARNLLNSADALLSGVEPDAEAFQFCGVHHKVPAPAFFLDLHSDSQRFGKLPGGAYHVFGIAAAKLYTPPGSAMAGSRFSITCRT